MDQEVGARRKLIARGPFRLTPSAVLEAERGLVVGQVGDAAALLLDAVTYGRVRMADERGSDVNGPISNTGRGTS